MRSSWTCCLLLLYHELLMPATFPPFGSLHTDFLLSILLLYITSYFTSIQKSAKIVLGLKQPEISAIMRAKFSRFSQERLIGFLNKLNQKVIIQISHHHEERALPAGHFCFLIYV